MVNIKAGNGESLVKGKRISGFTNKEENPVHLEQVVPFLLEPKFVKRGARFEKAGFWEPHVSVDQRVVTGQNPQSAGKVGTALLKELLK